MAGILTRGGTILGTARDKPFKNPVPDADTGLLPIEAIKKNYKKWKMDALVVLGGNGTNTTGSLLFEEGLNVVGLPKTIDNDIVGTDITFGFHTAVDVATEAIDRIHTTAHSHSRVMVIAIVMSMKVVRMMSAMTIIAAGNHLLKMDFSHYYIIRL